MNRGTELQKVWMAKPEKIINYVIGGFQDDFGTKVVSRDIILVFATALADHSKKPRW